MTTTLTPDLVETLTGTWDIDVSHSEVAFVIRHLMVSKVRGTFNDFSGAFVVGEGIGEGRHSDRPTENIFTRQRNRRA